MVESREQLGLTYVVATLLTLACSGPPPVDERLEPDAAPALASGAARATPSSERLGQLRAALSVEERLAACSADPRVVTGLVTLEVCTGADIFFRETFDGNGRTCGSCHPAANDTTLDVPFITRLHAQDPSDPLFVFERDPALAELETRDLLNGAAILENVDGFEAPTQKFVSRSVNHVLSLRTSIARDPGDGSASPPVERTGWGGDGSPEDGSLRSFLTGAVRQHFTRSLERREGTDFRLPTPEELDLTQTFQLQLGRLEDLDLSRVSPADAGAENGRQAFLDPNRGRCNACHANAGAGFDLTGLNRNFDQGARRLTGNMDLGLTAGFFDGKPFVDGGFGASEPIDGNGAGENNAFGDGSFSPPPLIEAADTGPFFHNNARGPEIEDAVAFYANINFTESPAAKALDARFGAPLALNAQDSNDIARLLRVLNAAFNMDIASQRLEAAQTLAGQLGGASTNIETGLQALAGEEIDDALRVLGAVALHPEAQADLSTAKDDLAAGRIGDALASLAAARAQLGSGIDYRLGQGTLMF